MIELCALNYENPPCPENFFDVHIKKWIFCLFDEKVVSEEKIRKMQDFSFEGILKEMNKKAN